MSKFVNFDECLKEMENRYKNNENVRKPLKNFENTLIITCVKENHGVLIKINKDQGIEIKDGVIDDSVPLQVHFRSKQILIDMFNKTLSPLKAYSTGKIKIIKGKKSLLIKLRKLLF